MKSAIEEAIALAEPISPQDPDIFLLKSQSVQTEIEVIKNLLTDLLGVENEARREFESRINRLKELESDFSNKNDQLKKLNKIVDVYHRLSLEPLKWRDAIGFPKLVVFSLTSPIWRLAVTIDGKFSVEPSLPENISKQYDDVLQLLGKRRSNGKELELTCRFKGLIPNEIRDKIKEARELFSGQIFIIAEPGSLTLKEFTPLPKGDPLIVGYDHSVDPNGLWLIADFDTTSVEEAMFLHSDNSQK